MMNTANMFFGIVAFLMILFVYINEMKNITEFIIKYKSIKDTARINMEQKCKNIYCEAETDRFQIAKNMYDLLLPNDIYNARTYTTMVMIFSILLFIYVLYLYVKYNDNILLSGLILLSVLALILTNIILRYIPYDAAGYKNYFMKSNESRFFPINSARSADIFNLAIYISIGGLLIIVYGFKVYLITHNKEEKNKFYKSLYFFFLSLYFVFAFYFMFNMVNIVEAFKTNVVPDDIYNDYHYVRDGGNYDEYWTADTAHDSEDYFYSIYFKLQEIPKYIFPLFNDNDDNQKYDINDVYIFRNLPNIGLVLFVLCLIIGFVLMFSKYDDVGEYISMLLPLVFLFFIIFVIVMFTTFNTAFNKYALYGVCKSSYARALNGLNNAVVPFIAMHEKDVGTGVNNLTDYRYNYIVLNVIISFFLNYVNMIENTRKVEYIPQIENEIRTLKLQYNNIGESSEYLVGKILKKFKDKISINDIQSKFNRIKETDITDFDKFEAYYKELFKDILTYENGNIPDIEPTEIETEYISLLNRIFFNKNKIIQNSDITLNYDSLVSKDITDKIINKSVLVDRIRYAVYYYINKLENFNNNIDKYNKIHDTERNTFLEDWLFYINDDNTIDPYKFIMIKTDITESTIEKKIPNYDRIYKDQVDKVINVYLTHIRSLYKDIYNNPGGYHYKGDGSGKVAIFNSQIKTSLKMLSNTQGTDTIDIQKTRENTDDKLEYLFQAFKKFKIKVDGKANYLTNVIETISNQLNNTDAEITVYTVDTTTSLNIKHDDTIKLSEIKGLNVSVEQDNDIYGLDILKEANFNARERFVLTYATNIIILGIVYWMLSRTKG